MSWGIALTLVAGAAPQQVPPTPKLPVFSETALSPALREEIQRETPGRLSALKTRIDGQWKVMSAEMPQETFQYVRNAKRMEIVRRLFGFVERELARGNTDGLAFAFLGTEDLKRFAALFDDEIKYWRMYPTAPGVTPAVIRVADFGAKGDNRTDNISAFDAAIAAAAKLAGRPSIIEIPEGDFRFSPKEKRTHLRLSGVTNCILRGVSPEKTRLWFDDINRCGTQIDKSVNATIENVDVASVRTPFFQGKVLEFNKPGGWVVLQQEPGTLRPDDEVFRVNGKWQGNCLGIFDEEGHEAVKDGWLEIFTTGTSEDLGDGRFKIHLQKDHFIYKRDNVLLRPGWNVVVPARKAFCQNAATGDGAYLCNYVNVWVRNGRGSSIAFCNGGQYSSAWRVHLKPLRKGLFTSSCADAIMNYRGTFIGECTFEQMNDDGANCHGLGRRIQRIENGDTVIADWLPGNYEVGDPMQIQDGVTGQYLYLGRVKRPGRDLRNGWVHNTTFADKLPEGIRTMESIKSNLTPEERARQMTGGLRPDASRVADLLYRPYLFGVGHVVYRSRFSSLRGSGAVLMCPNVLLDETTYEYMNRGVALTSLGHCVEGPSPYNVWIRNCTFRDCMMGVEGRVITATGRFADTAPVRGLILEGCTFERVGKPLLLTNIGDDAEIQSEL